MAQLHFDYSPHQFVQDHFPGFEHQQAPAHFEIHVMVKLLLHLLNLHRLCQIWFQQGQSGSKLPLHH